MYSFNQPEGLGSGTNTGEQQTIVRATGGSTHQESEMRIMDEYSHEYALDSFVGNGCPSCPAAST